MNTLLLCEDGKVLSYHREGLSLLVRVLTWDAYVVEVIFHGVVYINEVYAIDATLGKLTEQGPSNLPDVLIARMDDFGCSLDERSQLRTFRLLNQDGQSVLDVIAEQVESKRVKSNAS